MAARDVLSSSTCILHLGFVSCSLFVLCFTVSLFSRGYTGCMPLASSLMVEQLAEIVSLSFLRTLVVNVAD